MAINEYGLELPADSDEFDPSGDARALGDSLADSIMVPVVNDTARDALTAFAGLVVNRLDTGNLERYNGTDWKVLVPQSSPTPFISRWLAVDQKIPNGAYTTIKFDTEVVATGITWSASTGDFTVSEDGRYLVVFGVQFNGIAAGSRYGTISVNDSAVFRVGDFSAGSTNNSGAVGSHIVNCQAGDTIQVQVYQSSGGNLSLLGNPYRPNTAQISWVTP